jgi:hypothetical protein
MSQSEWITISPEQAKARGLPPISIRIDARSAGLFGDVFPTKDSFLAVSGPPGGPLLITIWDCTGLPSDPETVIRAKLVPPWTKELEIGAEDHGVLLGSDRTGRLFFTGSGRARVAWFGVVVERPQGSLLLGVGVSGADPEPIPAADILGHRALKKALETLQIE